MLVLVIMPVAVDIIPLYPFWLSFGLVLLLLYGVVLLSSLPVET